MVMSLNSHNSVDFSVLHFALLRLKYILSETDVARYRVTKRLPSANLAGI